MKSFIAVAVLVAMVTAQAPAPAPPGPAPPGPPSPLSPENEKAVCDDADLAKVCPAKGPADDICKKIVEKIHGTEPECHDAGVCAFKSAGNATAPAPAAPAGPPPPPPPPGPPGPPPPAAAPVKVYLSKNDKIEGYESAKSCPGGVHILVPKPGPAAPQPPKRK